MNPMDDAGRGMTLAQESHLDYIKERFEDSVDKKYRNGQKEHGGNMWRMTPLQLVDCALDEAVDQFVYLLTLRDNLLAAENGDTLDEDAYITPSTLREFKECGDECPGCWVCDADEEDDQYECCECHGGCSACDIGGPEEEAWKPND